MNDLTLPIQSPSPNDSQSVKELALEPVVVNHRSSQVRPAGHEPKSARRLADTKKPKPSRLASGSQHRHWWQ